jgi:molecular chaperone GrpE
VVDDRVTDDATDVTDGTATETAEVAEATGPAGEGSTLEESGGPIIRDKRRLDPQTGQVRATYAATEPSAADAAQQLIDHVDLPGAAASGPGPGAADLGAHQAELESARALADERLLDLQRLQAEYVNYRRRVDRDRDVARDAAVASVLEALLPVLDDIHLARQHGDLEGGPFAAIAEKLDATLGRFGLVRYGEPGESFDPTVHEALLHTQAELAEGTTETTVVQILQPGYRAGERVLRAARVAVADPQ